MPEVFLKGSGEDEGIIHVYLETFCWIQAHQHVLHESLEHRWGVTQPE